MNIYFTANQQFGRYGAIKEYNRPFTDVASMNTTLINNWNSIIQKEDLVFVLGNFAWDPETAENVINQLNGTIILLPGEYDKATKELVNSVKVDLRIKKVGFDLLEDKKLCFSYWPLTEWPKKEQNWPLILGYPNKRYKSNHKLNRINVTCDFWDYKPILVERIVALYNEPDVVNIN